MFLDSASWSLIYALLCGLYNHIVLRNMTSPIQCRLTKGKLFVLNPSVSEYHTKICWIRIVVIFQRNASEKMMWWSLYVCIYAFYICIWTVCKVVSISLAGKKFEDQVLHLWLFFVLFVGLVCTILYLYPYSHVRVLYICQIIKWQTEFHKFH